MTSRHFIYDVKSTISNITSTLCDLTSTVSVQPHPLYQWYHSHPIYDITYGILVTAFPLYLWYHIHYVWQHNTVSCWYHTRHMCDIICTTDDITSTLSHQTTIFMMSHPLRAWHHNHSIRHRTHCIFVITTSPLISYLLLYHIIPTISVTSYALYIISYQLLMSSHFFTYDITASIYETTFNMYGQIYTIRVASQPLFGVITLTVLTTSHTLCMTSHTLCISSHSPYVWYFCTIQDITYLLYDIKPPFLGHHMHYIWHRIYCACVITSTVLMISHQLNFWDLIRYIWWHNIHCILYHSYWMCVITPTFSMIDITPFVCRTSHPLYIQYHINSMRHHTHILWDHTTFCMSSYALILDILPTISDTTSTLSVSSRSVHQLYHTNSPYDITHTLCMTSQSVCMTSHEHFMTSHPYKYDITNSIFMT